jgi:hypothetical protein
MDGPAVERLINELNSPCAWQTVSGWDHAAQRYLGLVPLAEAWQRLDQNQRAKQAQLGVALRKLLEKIQFKDDLNSPRGFDPARIP